MATEQPAVVEISIPCRAEYVGVARLAILGVASRMRFSYDEVEDIRLAVGEACASAIDRCKRKSESSEKISILCEVEENKLTVEVSDTGGAPSEKPQEEVTDEQSLGALLMGLLVDEVETESTSEGVNRIRMVKYVER